MSEEKKTNGHDPMTVRMVEVLERIEVRLERIEAEAKGTNARLERLETEAKGTNARLDRLEVEAKGTNTRLDQALDTLTDVLDEQQQLHAGLDLANARIEGLTAEVHFTNVKIDVTNERLEGLATEVHFTNVRVDVTNERLEGLTAEVHGLRDDMKGALTARVLRLEEAVFKKTG
jgi:chromosome segregation ATPase